MADFWLREDGGRYVLEDGMGYWLLEDEGDEVGWVDVPRVSGGVWVDVGRVVE